MIFDQEDLLITIGNFLSYRDLTDFCTINKQHKLIENNLKYTFNTVKKLHKVLLLLNSQSYRRPRVNSWCRNVWEPTERFLF